MFKIVCCGGVADNMDNERDAVPDKFKCLSILKPVDPKVQTEVSQAIRDIQSYVDEKDREAEMMTLTKRDRAFIREDGIIVINWCYQNEIVLDKGDMAECMRVHTPLAFVMMLMMITIISGLHFSETACVQMH